MKTEVTFIGIVRKVVGARALVEISAGLSSNPIIEGRVYRIGQVGSFVRIPLGFLNLYGIVSMVGASELVDADSIEMVSNRGQRWLEVQLVGEAYRNEEFQRGVSVFPTLDDEVHVVTSNDLAIIYSTRKPSMIQIGTLAASVSLPAFADLDKIVTRHAAIVGSTGSGKSNAVAGLLKAITSGSFPSAQAVVIDPHGEYGAALKDCARVLSIGDPKNPLVVPFWALSFDELAWFLVDRRTASESPQDITLRDRIFTERKKNCGQLKSGAMAAVDVTPDSPIPFNLKQLWYDLYLEEFATLAVKGDRNQIAFKKDNRGQELKGNVEGVVPPEFEPPAPGDVAPYKSRQTPLLAGFLNKLTGRLRDRNFAFLLEPGKYDGGTYDLDALFGEWLGHDKNITVLDLSGVPPEVLDLVVGVVTRIVFEAMFWGRDLPGIGRQRPILFVYEEAHLYLPKGGTGQFVAGYSSKAVRRIFKEGRKYGVGAVVVSQRPSELDETVLSQCGTFIALRLSNSDDQGRVKSTVPDSLAGLFELMPALRTGEAIIMGEATQIPSRVRFALVEPRPKSDDPEPTKRWREKRVAKANYAEAVTTWRHQRQLKQKKGGEKNGKTAGSIK